MMLGRVARGRFIRMGLFYLFLSGCASSSLVTYSLDDKEIFVAPRPHLLIVAVSVLNDQRPVAEKEWSARLKIDAGPPSAVPALVTDRLANHLRISSIFNKVGILPGPFDPASSVQRQELAGLGVDAVLTGDLAHYYGWTGPDGRIEGHVQFSNLKLHSLHTGRVFWEGDITKRLERVEKQPGEDFLYASEALRGAVNQLTMKLAGRSFSALEIFYASQGEMSRWRVGVLFPKDLRPPEERNTRERKLKGDGSYSLYSDNVRSVNKPILCGIITTCITPDGEAAPFVDELAEEWVDRLQAANLFENVLLIESRGGTTEEMRQWNDEGIEAILISRLSHSWASVIPSTRVEPYPIWSGGMGYPRLFKAGALTRLDSVQLVATETEEVLWEGEAQFAIDRTIERWESPIKFQKESLRGALDRITRQISQFLADSIDKTPEF